MFVVVLVACLFWFSEMRLRMVMIHLTLLLALQVSSQQTAPLPAVKTEVYEQFQLALDAILGVGIRLQAVFADDQKENFLVSPVSAAIILGQLMLGAEGEFRKQLVNLISLPNSHLYENDKISRYGKKNVTYSLPYSTFHVQLSNLLKHLETDKNSTKHFILKQKSGVFLNDKISLKQEFRRNLRNFYESHIKSLDFTRKPLLAQKTINDWVARNTNGLIKTIANQPPSPQTSSVFANAVYFLGEWEVPFSDELNKVELFNVSATKQVQVTYMMGFIEQIFYSESTDYRMVGLPYKNEELTMYIIVPKRESRFKYNIKEFVANLKSTEVLETMSKAKRRDVVVKIPKMSISNSLSILDQLKKYSVFSKQPDVTTSKSDSAFDKIERKVHAFRSFNPNEKSDVYLTNAAQGADLRIDDIVQHVVMTVNEKGTEAAAVSVSTMDYIGGSKNFVVDRPFVLFIRHEATSATLFWGTISNPAP